jgi:hypothetical protein
MAEKIISKRPNWVGVFPPHLRTETDPVPETSCFLFSWIPDDRKRLKTHYRHCGEDVLRLRFYCMWDHAVWYILWRIDPLLGNASVNTFPREPTRAIARLLIGNGSINTPKTIRDNRRRCFLWGPPRCYITGSAKGAVSCQQLREFNWRRVHLSQLLSRIRSSSGDGSLMWLIINDKKRIRLWKDFMCDLKLQWDRYKSVARIRLVKTENPSACVTVNCEVWKQS